MTTWAIVVAAGGGSRFGSAKQYETLGDRRVLDWAVTATRAVASGVVLAVPPERQEMPEPSVEIVVAGGATRSESVRAALACVPMDADIVVVHDAARPLAAASLFDAVVAEVRAGVDGAVPGLAVTDTIKRVRDGKVVETVERQGLVAVQTPQAFRASVLRMAHCQDADSTDDAALVEAVGGAVAIVDGDRANLKLTDPEDLEKARSLLAGMTG